MKPEKRSSFTRLSSFAILVIFALCPVVIFSQDNDYSLKSSDGELGMTVSRSEEGIEIALMFSHATQFEYVVIERSSDAMNNFSQIKYIKFNESANDEVVIVKRDTYPLSTSDDVYYRVKTITKEGVSRVYPSVRLPGLHKDGKGKY